MVSRPVVESVFLITAFTLLNSSEGIAYDPDCAHAVLTKRTVALYKEHFGVDIASQYVDRMVAGVIHEDLGRGLPTTIPFVRSTNHFYDIKNMRPWSPTGLGGDFIRTQVVCFNALLIGGFVHTAKSWALDKGPQQQGLGCPCCYDGDFSWPAMIPLLDVGDISGTSYTVGHILHLIQDLTVPAHTRNDTHVFHKDGYETHAELRCRSGRIAEANVLYLRNVRPIVRQGLGDYFDESATYASSHFLSDDTKFSKDYETPPARRSSERIGRQVHTFLYATDNTSIMYGLSGEYRLIEVNTLVERFTSSTDLVYKISYECLEDYWDRLSIRAIAYGAGVLHKLAGEANVRGVCAFSPDGVPCRGGRCRSGACMLTPPGKYPVF